MFTNTCTQLQLQYNQEEANAIIYRLRKKNSELTEDCQQLMAEISNANIKSDRFEIELKVSNADLLLYCTHSLTDEYINWVLAK